jgi:pimeloyl-ACP methyl ester carboxylesterase
MRNLSVVGLIFLFANCNYNGGKAGFSIILGTKLYYEEYGQGVPLIILSGGGINRSVRDFDKCIPKLSSKFRVILPDSPGQGNSQQPDTLSYEILTNFFSLFIDSLHLDSVYVMGWSDGGIAALLLAERKPDKVKKVIAVGANNGLKGALPAEIDISLVKPQRLDVWADNNKEVVAAYTKDLKKDWRRMMANLNRMWYQEKYFSDSVLGRIQIPTMIVQGDKDDIIIDHAVELHRMIPNSQLCILPNTTHEVFSERADLICNLAMIFFGQPL